MIFFKKKDSRQELIDAMRKASETLEQEGPVSADILHRIGDELEPLVKKYCEE